MGVRILMASDPCETLKECIESLVARVALGVSSAMAMACEYSSLHSLAMSIHLVAGANTLLSP